MSRKPRKGYYVKGQFVAEGSELDLHYKAELRGSSEPSKTELKRESAALQTLGEALLSLRSDLFERLDLPDALLQALDQARSITSFEGRRRQMQFVGKLMRKLESEKIAEIETALEEQRCGSSAEKIILHQAEHWRERLLTDDGSLQAWLADYPSTEIQPLRALIRQARKDAALSNDGATQEQTLAPRKGRAYRELYQLLRTHLQGDATGDPKQAANSDQPSTT